MEVMIIRHALREINRRKLRSFTSSMGYSIGLAFLIIVVTLSQSYNLVAEGALNRIGTHFVVYIPASKSCPCQFGEVGPFFKDAYTPTFDLSIIETVEAIEGVADAAPCLMFKLNNLTICGVDFDSLATGTTVVSSKMVLDGNYSRIYESGSILLDSVFALLEGLEVNDQISVFNRNFTVVGTVNPSLYSRPAGIADMYAPLPVVKEIADYYGDLYDFAIKDINVVLVEISAEGDSEQISSVEHSVLRTVEFYGGQAGALVGYQCGVAARQVIPITQDNAWAISVVLLFSAVIFALKSQFASVSERTREIGVLKALGWTDFDVTKQILVESLIIGVLGGIVGVAVGYLIAFMIPQLGWVPTQNLVMRISPFLVMVGIVVSVVGGAIAGLIPAWRAGKMLPAEALRRF